MTLSITHPFHSSKGDGADSTLVQPSNWNANHTITMASGFVLGRKTAGTGTAEELSPSDLATLGVTLPSGTRMLFQQTAAPTGWTKDVTNDDAALRVVSGSVVNGGTQGFTATVFGAAKATGSHVLAATEIPSHTHTFSATTTTDGNHSHSYTAPNGSQSVANGGNSAVQSTSGNSTGSAGAHSHTLSGTTSATGGGLGHTHTLSLDLKYVDVIVAAKN